MHTRLLLRPAALLLVVSLASAVSAGEPSAEVYTKMVNRGIEYLATHGQAEDGSYTAAAGPAVTALATTAVLKHGRSAKDPLVARSLKYLQTFVQPGGGIYPPESQHKNYNTCLSMLCFAAANQDGRYDEIIKNADRAVKGMQWTAEEGAQEADTAYGGAGYGKHKRPDMSNTQFFIEALRASGNHYNDDAIQRALIFVSRAQNLESAHNQTKFPALVNDGGFYYTPAAGGQSQAGQTDNGGLRSYGSMTYAGLKSMIFAGVEKNDPRVQAALKWAQKHYTLEANPGMQTAGLFYYYHTLAKALDAAEVDTVTDAQGKTHDWRAELIAELARRQQPNGSWINENQRWLEGDANLVTSYALLTLSYCRPRK